MKRVAPCCAPVPVNSFTTLRLSFLPLVPVLAGLLRAFELGKLPDDLEVRFHSHQLRHSLHIACQTGLGLLGKASKF